MLKIGCHLFPWNSVLNQDGVLSYKTAKVLEWLSGQGVQAIEVGARFIPEGKEAEVSRLFASFGLAIAGLHMGAPVYSDSCEEKLTEIFEEINRLQSVKSERIVLSGGGGKGALSNEGAARAAGFLNRIGEACNKVGLELSYHNHGWEFSEQGRVERILLKETDPEQVSFALDIGWIYSVGTDPVAFYRENASRVSHLHLRDVQGSHFIEVGEGEVNYAALIQSAKELGYTGWYLVEMELGAHYSGNAATPEQSVEISLQNLKRLS